MTCCNRTKSLTGFSGINQAEFEDLVALLYLMLLQHNSGTSEICLDALRLSFTVTLIPDRKNISVGTIAVFSLFPLLNPTRQATLK